ncbi:MAG TPA: type III-B CRISPR module RAMP protein Cmr1 [Thermoanaerobaculia bacterium]|nr:type III-B CRISPR module RAMP protein Cmr1 [Thermoanaerobaculia bacterium]
MRAAPLSPPESVIRKAQHFEDRQYQFLTYVFGGGVKIREHEKHGDPITPVRVASIRGQLRFWWRACNPSCCETVAELRQHEGEIWGTTSRASKVEITLLTKVSPPREVPVFEYSPAQRLVIRSGMREIAYGAFPLQPSRDEQRAGAKPWALFDYGKTIFSLRFLYPKEYQKDVQAALWAWETFGGLGGRTRRGFGAIARVNAQSSVPVESELARYRENPRIAGVPSLYKARFAVASTSTSTPVESWKTGLGLLQRIRQGPGFGRNMSSPGSLKPAGRSRWPEPDEIRRLTRKSAPIHRKPEVAVSCFPRAVFGMPIVFHFHPGSTNEPGSAGDPDMKPLQLQPVGFERYASPLIIRPISDGTSFRASALVLSSDVPTAELVADEASYSAAFTLNTNLARGIQPLNRDGRVFTDPLELFLSELKK